MRLHRQDQRPIVRFPWLTFPFFEVENEQEWRQYREHYVIPESWQKPTFEANLPRWRTQLWNHRPVWLQLLLLRQLVESFEMYRGQFDGPWASREYQQSLGCLLQLFNVHHLDGENGTWTWANVVLAFAVRKPS